MDITLSSTISNLVINYLPINDILIKTLLSSLLIGIITYVIKWRKKWRLTMFCAKTTFNVGVFDKETAKNFTNIFENISKIYKVIEMYCTDYYGNLVPISINKNIKYIGQHNPRRPFDCCCYVIFQLDDCKLLIKTEKENYSFNNYFDAMHKTNNLFMELNSVNFEFDKYFSTQEMEEIEEKLFRPKLETLNGEIPYFTVSNENIDKSSSFSDKTTNIIIGEKDMHYVWKSNKPLRHTITADTYIMSDTFKNDVLNRVSDFHSDYDIYDRHKLPHNISFLLSGPPGSGKTCSIHMLANEFHLPIYNLTIEKNMSETNFIELLKYDEDTEAIIVLDDFDLKTNQNISVNTIKRAFDGICKSNNRILIITTNHPEEFRNSPDLMRSERIDFDVEISYCTNKQIIDICNSIIDKKEQQLRMDDISKFNKKIVAGNLISNLITRKIKTREGVLKYLAQ
jgi:hypothetical protein